MKHLSRCVPATLSLILSFTPPGGLLADTGLFLSNSEVTVSSALTHIDAPQSSLSHQVEEQPQIILATGGIGGAVGRAATKAGKAATKAPPPPPRSKPTKPVADQYDQVNSPLNREYERISPSQLLPESASRTGLPTSPQSIYSNAGLTPKLMPKTKPSILKNVAKGVGLTVLTGGVIVSGAALTYFGLVGAGIIEPINWEETFAP